MDIGELYDEYEITLHRFAIGLTHDDQWADDLVQDTLVQAMGHLQLLGVLKKHQCRAWLFRTLKNRFIDEKRRFDRHDLLLQTLSSFQDIPAAYTQNFGVEPDPFALVPEQYRDLVHMRYVLDMNSTEIGEELGIPAATVRSRLYLALKQMRFKAHKLI